MTRKEDESDDKFCTDYNLQPKGQLKDLKQSQQPHSLNELYNI